MAGTDNCSQVCINTEGGFSCGCRPGLRLNSDRRTCSGQCISIVLSFSVSFRGGNNPLSPDIDECASDDTNSCEQQCINSVGSYTCKCNDGFTLNSDGTTCSGEITGSSSHRVSNAKQSWHLICTHATIYSMLQILMSVS